MKTVYFCLTPPHPRSTDEFEEESSQDFLGCLEEEQEDVADYIPGAITIVKHLTNIIVLWSNKLKTSKQIVLC